ncbi:hypothetical protein PG999_013556 [Apiospora kogelbergensis]|uniref:Uncharacterized protein n=1 Tax=Apiospora kogelbergensis TaxID=1337665 RepID=A0AAW0QAB9_9PEZI
MIRAGIAALALAALTQASPIPDDKPVLEERQFQIGNPWTGIWPPGPPAPTPIITFPGGDVDSGASVEVGSSIEAEKRQKLGGSQPSSLKQKLTALELEYESLVQQYGKHTPSNVTRRLKEIEAELRKYGIAIIATPDGTSTVITFGKVKRQLTIGDGGYGDPAFNLIGLETTLEQLMQEYGPNPPHDIYIIEERIKNILAAYGITIISAPDGTITIITPSTKREAASYDVEALRVIFDSFVPKYNGQRPPMADWVVIQDIAAILRSYGIATSVKTPEQSIPTATKRASPIDLSDSVNTELLQVLYHMLLGAYGNSADTPRDIFLIQQSIVTILGAQGIVIPGWKTVPGGPMVPDRPVTGGPLVPDATIPGGPMIPDVTVPGGEMKPSTKRDNSALKGLRTVLSTLEAQYGTFASTAVPVQVLLIMQNVVTVLQANDFIIPGWPPLLGPGTVVIGPST